MVKSIIKASIFSLLIGIISYPIIAFINGGFKANKLKNQYLEICKEPENVDCERVLREISYLGTDKNTSEIYEQKFPIQGADRIFGEPDGKEIMNRYSEMYKGLSEVIELKRFDDYVILKLRSYNKTLENTIYRSFKKPAIIDAFTISLLFFLILIIGQYAKKFISKEVN